jgi:hypothetical protein
VLPAVRVPTLVLYRPVWKGALDVAARIPSARAMRVSGNDHHGIFLSLDIADEIERFVAGEEAPFVPESVLATVLFTDLVSSTEHAAQLGDRAWRDLLTRHHGDVRRELARHRGEEVDTAGDGFFCRFDGPAGATACARAISGGAKELDLDVRSGIHTGECELVGDKIAGPRRRHGCPHLVACGPRRSARLGHSQGSCRGFGVRFRGPRCARAQGRAGHLEALRSGVRLTDRAKAVPLGAVMKWPFRRAHEMNLNAIAAWLVARGREIKGSPGMFVGVAVPLG